MRSWRGHQRACQCHRVAAPQHWARPEAADGVQPLTASGTPSGHHTRCAGHPQCPQEHPSVTSVSCTKSGHTPAAQCLCVLDPAPELGQSQPITGGQFPPILTLAPEILLLCHFRWTKLWTILWTIFPERSSTACDLMAGVLCKHKKLRIYYHWLKLYQQGKQSRAKQHLLQLWHLKWDIFPTSDQQSASHSF